MDAMLLSESFDRFTTDVSLVARHLEQSSVTSARQSTPTAYRAKTHSMPWAPAPIRHSVCRVMGEKPPLMTNEVQ